MQYQLQRQGLQSTTSSRRCATQTKSSIPTPRPSSAAPLIAPKHLAAPSRSRITVSAEPAAAAPQQQQSAPAAQTQPPNVPPKRDPSQPKSWYAVIANAEFFFNDPQNESLAEQLRERVRYFKEIKREIDFFIVPEPKWLDPKFPQQAKQVKRPCVAIMSTDKTWITFMKLRLDRVLRLDLDNVTDAEALAVGGKVPEFKNPEKWTAPYPGYTPGWWDKFIPQY